MKAHTRFSVVIFSLFGLWVSVAMGAKLDLGARDFYFGKDAPYSTQYAKNTGNCAAHLSAANYKNARVIIYPESGHGVTYNQYMKSDLLGFLSYWVGRAVD